MANKKSLLDFWKEHPTRRSELVALLREPALIDAIAIVKEQSYKPHPLPTNLQGNVTLTEWGAMIGWKREGYLESLTNFLGLAEITPHQMPDRKPWDSPGKEEKVKEAEQVAAAPIAQPQSPPAATGPAQPS